MQTATWLVGVALLALQGEAGADAGMGAGAAGSKPPRIAVGALGSDTLAPALRKRLEEAMAAGLAASGAEVVSPAALSRARSGAGLGTCDDAACLRRLGELTGAAYWVRGTCHVEASTYRLHLELVEVRTEVVAAARDDTCEICTEADAAETASLAASTLKASLGKPAARANGAATAAPVARPLPATAPMAAPPVPAATAGQPAAAPGTVPPPAGIDGASPPAAARPRWRRLLPWLSLAGGVAAGAAGAYYLSLDGDGTCASGDDTCPRLYDTKTQGFAWLGIGAALAVTGTVLLLLPAPAEVQVAVSPAGIAASATF